MPKIVADAIDQMISTEMRPGAGLPRGVNRLLYEAAREAQGGDPLVYLAGERLLKEVSHRDFVLFVTGAGHPMGLHLGETDGPPGAASIARVLDFGLGARCVFACDTNHVGPLVASVNATGISVIDAERMGKRPHTALVEVIPNGIEGSKAFAAEILKRYAPKAVVFVEKIGPGKDGLNRTVTGSARDPSEGGHACYIADLAREQGIFTLGIGDGGNEIGNGLIREAVERIQPHPEMATVTATDVLVYASISNWGAYGVAAYLAYALKNIELFQDEEMEDFMIRQCVAAGGTDGAYAAQLLRVDGVSLRTNLAVVAVLREIVRNGLKEVYRGF